MFYRRWKTHQKNQFIVTTIFLMTFLAYFNALNIDFIGDDLGRIVYEQNLTKDFTTAISTIMPDRPVLTASLWLNYTFHQLNPFYYKVVSLLLHALVGIVLIFLILELIPYYKEHWNIALVLGFLFIVHPLNNQAINSISQRGVLLSTLFTLLAFYVFIQADKKSNLRLYVISLLLSILAVLSKTNAIIIPLIFMAYLSIYRANSFKQTLVKISPFFVIALLPLTYYFALNINEQYGTLSSEEYFLIQIRATLIYLKLFILPTDLHFLYNFDSNLGFWSWPNIGAIILHLCIFSFIFFMIKKKSRAFVFFAVALYIAFLPESSVFPIRHVFFEHRAYLPLIFFIGIVALFIKYAYQKMRSNKHPIILSCLLITLIALAGININYNQNIKTYSDWVFYNYSKNKNDIHFNIFNLNEFLDSNPEAGKKFVKNLIQDNPNDVTFKLYEKIFNYESYLDLQKQEVLSDLQSTLLMTSITIHRHARIKFIQFYGRSIQKFLSQPEYWEAIDDLIYYQMDILKQKSSFFSSIFLIYRANLERLLYHYRQNTSRSPERYLRTLYALKYFFAIKYSSLEEEIQSLKTTTSETDTIKKLIHHFETMPPTHTSLPLTRDRIE